MAKDDKRHFTLHEAYLLVKKLLQLPPVTNQEVPHAARHTL